MNRTLFVMALLTCVALPSFSQTLQVYARDFEPFFYRDGDTIKGLELEILEYYSRTSGKELEIHFVDEFEELLPAVRSGKADISAGTITITEARAETVDFSGSYFPVRVVVVEPETRTTEQLSDLSGLTVSTMPATTYEGILKDVPGVELVFAVDEAAMISLVASGEADATVVDTVLGLIYVPRHEGLHMSLHVSDLQHYGFAVPKGSPLSRELSRHIQRLKSSGIYYRLLEKYLGQDAVEMVRAATKE